MVSGTHPILSAVVSAAVWHWEARCPCNVPAMSVRCPPVLLAVFPCGPGSREWEYFDGKCYYFSLARTSWHKAKAHCEEMHSQLAVINSYAKQVKHSNEITMK